VIWDGKPLTGEKKGSWAQGNRKSRDLNGKTAEEGGFKVQSPIQAAGVILESKQRRHVGKK